MAGPEKFDEILDSVSYRFRAAAQRAFNGGLSIQNVAGTLCQVDDLGNITALIGGTIGGITAITGDVVATGPGVVNSTIQPGRVTYAKIQNVSDAVLLGNNSGGAASVQELTKAQVISFLGLAAIATSGSAGDLTSGTLPAGRFPALTGDVTTLAGSLVTTVNIPATRVPYGNGSGHMTSSANLLYNDSVSQWVVQTPGTTATAATAVGLMGVYSDTATNASVVVSQSSLTGIGSGIFRWQKSRGTFAVPLAVGNLDNTSRLTGSAYSGSSYNNSWELDGTVDGTASIGPTFGVPVNVGFYMADVSGTQLHAPALAVTYQRDIILQTYALNTTATAGFTYYTSTPGVPTGAPVLASIKDFTTTTGVAPQGIPSVIDSVNRRLYGNFGGSWHYAAFDDGSSSGITQLVGDAQAGPGTGVQTLTILPNVVTLAKMQQIATNSLLGRSTAGTGNVEVITVGSGLTLTGGTLTSTSSGGTITALTGDVTASGSGSVTATIAAGAVTTSKIAALNITTALLAAASVTTAKVANNAVTYALIQTQADQTILGNVSGGTASPSALTKSQVLALLNSSLTTGIVGVTATSGALNSSPLTNTDVLFATGANTIGQDSQFTYNSTTHVLSASTVTAGLVQGGAGNILTLRSESGAAVSLALNSITTAAELKGPLVPTTTDTYSLGSTSLRWAQMYVTTVNGNDGAGLLNLKSESTGAVELTLSAGSSAVVVTGNVIPHANITYDLGTGSDAWHNLFTQNITAPTSFDLSIVSGGAISVFASNLIQMHLRHNRQHADCRPGSGWLRVASRICEQHDGQRRRRHDHDRSRPDRLARDGSRVAHHQERVGHRSLHPLLLGDPTWKTRRRQRSSPRSRRSNSRMLGCAWRW